METLTTQTVNTQFNSPSSVYQSGGQFKLEIPQSSVMIAKPISYDFRVVEIVNEKNEIVKVGLQYKIWEHDNHGVAVLKKDWTDVERVKIPSV